MKLNIILSLLCGSFFVGVCQTPKNLKEADKKFSNFAYVDARKIYEELFESSSVNDDILKKLGDSYYFNNELDKSVKYYEKLYNQNKFVESQYLHRYAMALKSINNNEKAEKVLLEYYKKVNPDGSLLVYKKKDEFLKASLEKNKDKFSISKSNFNSENADFSPAIFQSKLIFSSNRLDDKNKSDIDKWTNKPYIRLYSVNLNRDNSTSEEPVLFAKELDSPYHESTATFSKDGKTMYFTRNDINPNKVKENRSTNDTRLHKIYKATLSDDNKWEKVKLLPFNNKDFSCAHPVLSGDGKSLYFVSNMPGTLGDSDIFYVDVFDNDTYGAPVNLGDKINTSARETFPFISEDNKLYFASNGHLGLGGLDVFVSDILPNKVFSAPSNLGEPLNSKNDDFGLIFDPVEKIGFFSSNRGNTSGLDDIYRISLNDPLQMLVLKGKVNHEISKKPIAGAKMILFDDEMNKVSETTTDMAGKYSFKIADKSIYAVRAMPEGYLEEEKIYLADKLDVDFEVKEGEKLGKIEVKYGDDMAKILQLLPIYFDFNKDFIRPDAEFELAKILRFMKEYPDAIIDVRSHTDSRGSAQSNLSLSQRRATSTVNYLISKGISPSRLSGRGYGFTQLVNRCSPGVPCSEVEHQFNRRSEFIILNKEGLDIDPTKLQIVDKNLGKTETSIQVDLTPKEVVGVNSTSSTDYEAAFYTVQLAAGRTVNPTLCSNVTGSFYKQFADGYVRYFAGKFITKADALAHKNKLIAAGQSSTIFVVKLDGDRIIR